MITIVTDYATYTCDDSQKTQRKVFDKVIEYFKEYEAFYGESIMQSDDPQIYAPQVMAEIADGILCWKCEEGE